MRLAEFFTVSCNAHKRLLQPDSHKMILIDSLKYLHKRELIKLYGYVIMDNHFHLLWAKSGTDVERRFLSFTAHELKKSVALNYPHWLEAYKSEKPNKAYELFGNSQIAYLTKETEISSVLNYIHRNPYKAQITGYRGYKYSSERFYSDGEDPFGILTRFEI